LVEDVRTSVRDARDKACWRAEKATETEFTTETIAGARLQAKAPIAGTPEKDGELMGLADAVPDVATEDRDAALAVDRQTAQLLGSIAILSAHFEGRRTIAAT
jgi:hypothetical protein